MPPKTGSKVRLFNLAADVPSAGLSDASGKALVSGVKYTLGSVWAPIPAAAGTFTATSATGGTVASAPMTPPNAPQVFTAFLLGVKGFGYTLMPQIDAPVSGGMAGPVALLLLSSPRVRAGVWAVPTRRCRAAGGVLGQLVGRGRELDNLARGVVYRSFLVGGFVAQLVPAPFIPRQQKHLSPYSQPSTRAVLTVSQSDASPRRRR